MKWDTSTQTEIKSWGTYVTTNIVLSSPEVSGRKSHTKRSFFVPPAKFPDFSEFSDLKEVFADSRSQFQVLDTHFTQYFYQKGGLLLNDLSFQKEIYMFSHFISAFCTSYVYICWAKSWLLSPLLSPLFFNALQFCDYRNPALNFLRVALQ